MRISFKGKSERFAAARGASAATNHKGEHVSERKPFCTFPVGLLLVLASVVASLADAQVSPEREVSPPRAGIVLVSGHTITGGQTIICPGETIPKSGYCWQRVNDPSIHVGSNVQTTYDNLASNFVILGGTGWVQLGYLTLTVYDVHEGGFIVAGQGGASIHWLAFNPPATVQNCGDLVGEWNVDWRTADGRSGLTGSGSVGRKGLCTFLMDLETIVVTFTAQDRVNTSFILSISGDPTAATGTASITNNGAGEPISLQGTWSQPSPTGLTGSLTMQRIK